MHRSRLALLAALVTLISFIGTAIGAVPARAAALPVLDVGDVAQLEGNGGQTQFLFTVTLTPASTQDVIVYFSTQDGTATSAAGFGQDYVALPLTQLYFPPGTTTRTITVVVNGDTLLEPDETFFVNLADPLNATIGKGQGVGTIVNDDGPPAMSIADASAPEGDGGTSALAFAVSLSFPAGATVSAQYATSDGTARAGVDYVATTGTVAFTPGQLTTTVSVPILGNTLPEPNKTFLVTLSAPSNATLARSQATGTILNDDAPALSIGDLSQAEGNAGQTLFRFPVTLAVPTTKVVTVTYATADGTATSAGPLQDYVPLPPTPLVFGPGETAKTVTVVVNGDTLLEPDETFFVDLSAPVNATLGKSRGTGTIQNDDALPSLAVADRTLAEGNGGTTPFTFAVTLSQPAAVAVSVAYVTTDGTATSAAGPAQDYQPVSGTLAFAPGETVKSVTVLVNGDTVFEPDETFSVDLSGAVNATIARARGVGTILNDDPAPVPVASISDVTRARQPAGQTDFVFTVSLSIPSASEARVTFHTEDGTANSDPAIPGDVDYVSLPPTALIVPAGATSRTITVRVNGQSEILVSEDFFVVLSDPVNAVLGKDRGHGVILASGTPAPSTDATPPSLTVPPDVFASTGPGATACGTVVSDATLGTPIASDDSGSVTVTRLGTPAGSVFPVGTTVITYRAEDPSGNVTFATQNVTVTDTTSPTIAAPRDIVVGTGAGSTSPNAVVPDAVLGAPVAADNCASVTVGRTGVPAGNVFPVGTTVLQYQATDGSGNVGVATQLVTVLDTTPPVLSVPLDLAVDPTSATGAAVAFAASAKDNVGVRAFGCLPPSGSVFPIGTTTVSCSASDAARNTASAFFTVHVRSAAELVARLAGEICSPGPFGPGKSLCKKLEELAKAIAKEDLRARARTEREPCEKLEAFVHEVAAQTGRSLTAAQASLALSEAARIRAALGCR